MSQDIQTPADHVSDELQTVKIRSFKLPVALVILPVLMAVLFMQVPREGTSTFNLGSGALSYDLPHIDLPSGPVAWTMLVLLLLLAAYSVYRAVTYQKTQIPVLIVYGLLLVFAFLVWASANGTVPVTSLLAGSLSLAIPLIFGALGGVIGERVGVVNVAIEAQFLLAAFNAALLGSITKNPFVGLVGALIGGILVAWVLSAFALKYLVEQVVVGVVLNVLVLGLTSFLHGALLMSNEQAFNRPATFDRIRIPGLVEIPVLGPVLFNQPIIVYLAYIAVAAVAWGLYRTKWGLRLRAVGEHPKAADTVGIKVIPTRFWNMTLAGAIAGMGGAYLTLVSVPQFGKDMTAGIGFIALAAVIFGRWDPIKATLAALLFGFATNLQNLLTVLKTPVPSEFMLMLPYLITLIAVVSFAGKVRGPAAAGKPYIKG